jgi:hypothetical protein
MVPVAGGEVVIVEFTSGLFASGGDVIAHFPEGVVLRGRWSVVDEGADLGLVTVFTPNGPVTATTLVASGTPNGVATLTSREGTTAICTFTGTYGSGVASCADSTGRRYVGNW